ncbi:MAG: type IX secretion system protein PorQ [Ignavibacteria bacterium]|nr:type IX secretion system protein PorQ [Ignavibacteria bacterium]
MRKNILALLIICVFSIKLFSQVNSTYNFLKLEVDARSAALAGSLIATENDVNMIFYNPACLATINKPQASVGFFKYLLDINSGNAAYAQSYNNLGHFGASIRYINYGEFDKYDENFNRLGTFSANDIALTLGYANSYNDNLFYGANIKFIYSNIDEYKSTAIALDLGAIYKITSYDLNIGVSILNIGKQLSSYIDTKENLPLDLKIGATKKLEYLPLTVSFTFSNLIEKTDKFIDRFKFFTVGGEFTLSEYVVLRGGYDNQKRQDLKTGTSLGLGGFSAGIGLRYEDKYFLDYSFNSLGKIGSSHRINLKYIFLK